MALIDTDFARNVQRVRPFLGVFLVASVALWFFTLFNNAMQELTQAVHSEAPIDVEGTIKLAVRNPVQYGDKVSYKSTVYGAKKGATTYISTACFQGETLVYQRTVQQGTSFFLTDQYERDLNWDGAAASCSATLLYRVASGGQAEVYILDSVTFEVVAQE